MPVPVTETVWRRLSAGGLRRTPQREAILDALGDADAGLPLPVLLARGRRRAPGLGERTAERTVALLVEHGAVDAIARPGGEVVYRLCGRGHHHHIVCTACGAVAEIAECDVARWAAGEAARHGFIVEGHDVTVHGRCAACRAARGRGQPRGGRPSRTATSSSAAARARVTSGTRSAHATVPVPAARRRRRRAARTARRARSREVITPGA